MKDRFHYIAVNHDYIKAFVIVYVGLSAAVAVFFGLFYFLLWIMAHFLLSCTRGTIPSEAWTSMISWSPYSTRR